MKKATKKLAKIAEKQGFLVEQTKNGHIRFVPADKSKDIVIASGSASDHRSQKNLIAQLRKSGLSI